GVRALFVQFADRDPGVAAERRAVERVFVERAGEAVRREGGVSNADQEAVLEACRLGGALGAGPALGPGLALLGPAAGDSKALSGIAALASACLARDPRDPTRQAIGALASLAAARVPLRPLGPGRLGLAGVPDESQLQALLAAREVGGRAARDVAWVLV